MGKAAERRKARRQQYLAALAARNPEKFREEWNKRVESWLLEVWSRAGRLRDEQGNPVPPAFEVVDAAHRLLTNCGDQETTREAYESLDVLAHECCRAVSVHVDGRLYHLNVKVNIEQD